jgi:hypothetical protein
MGANQSKTPLSNEKLVIERLRALEIKDQADNDYVHVDEKDVSKPIKSIRYKAPWTTLSVDEVEHWEHELLQDPKNRSVYIPSIYDPANVPGSHYPPSPPQTPKPYSQVEQRTSKTNRFSTSRSHLKAPQ